MGPGQNLLTRVGLGQPPLKLENFPQLSQFFPLMSKISSSRVKKYLGQGQVGPLFTAGKNYARVGSGPIRNVYTIVHLQFGLKNCLHRCGLTPQPLISDIHKVAYLATC